MTLLALVVGLLLGIGWLWLYWERKSLLAMVQDQELESHAVKQENKRILDLMEALVDRILALESPTIRAQHQIGERERVAARLKQQPRYAGASDEVMEAAVDQIVGGLGKMKPKERV